MGSNREKIPCRSNDLRWPTLPDCQWSKAMRRDCHPNLTYRNMNPHEESNQMLSELSPFITITITSSLRSFLTPSTTITNQFAPPWTPSPISSNLLRSPSLNRSRTPNTTTQQVGTSFLTIGIRPITLQWAWAWGWQKEEKASRIATMNSQVLSIIRKMGAKVVVERIWWRERAEWMQPMQTCPLNSSNDSSLQLKPSKPVNLLTCKVSMVEAVIITIIISSKGARRLIELHALKPRLSPWVEPLIKIKPTRLLQEGTPTITRTIWSKTKTQWPFQSTSRITNREASKTRVLKRFVRESISKPISNIMITWRVVLSWQIRLANLQMINSSIGVRWWGKAKSNWATLVCRISTTINSALYTDWQVRTTLQQSW